MCHVTGPAFRSVSGAFEPPAGSYFAYPKFPHSEREEEERRFFLPTYKGPVRAISALTCSSLTPRSRSLALSLTSRHFSLSPSFYANTSTSTNFTMSCLPTDLRQASKKSPTSNSEHRRLNKPIMERKRRQRINRCLDELKNLLLDSVNKDVSYQKVF